MLQEVFRDFQLPLGTLLNFADVGEDRLEAAGIGGRVAFVIFDEGDVVTMVLQSELA
jgi:hypothetical protein